MKKFTLIFVMVLASGIAFGQFSIGPKIGFNTNKLTTELDEYSSDVTNNFHFGAFVRFGTKYYLQPEVNWLTIGGVLEDKASLNPLKTEIEMKSIEIPVIVGVRLLNFGVGNVRILLGPSGTIVMDKTVKADASITDPIEEADLEDLLWGFNVGAGVDVLMFTLDVRYQMGLNEVLTKVQNFDINSKNNMFSISLGWKIL